MCVVLGHVIKDGCGRRRSDLSSDHCDDYVHILSHIINNTKHTLSYIHTRTGRGRQAIHLHRHQAPHFSLPPLSIHPPPPPTHPSPSPHHTQKHKHQPLHTHIPNPQHHHIDPMVGLTKRRVQSGRKDAEGGGRPEKTMGQSTEELQRTLYQHFNHTAKLNHAWRVCS